MASVRYLVKSDDLKPLYDRLSEFAALAKVKQSYHPVLLHLSAENFVILFSLADLVQDWEEWQ